MSRVKVYQPAVFEESAEVFATFDPARARGRWSDREADGSGSGGPGRGEAVVLAGDGRARWILERWTDWAGEASRYERMHAGDARDWLDRNGFTEAVAGHFGDTPSLEDAVLDMRLYREVASRRDEIVTRAYAAQKAATGEGNIRQISLETGLSRATVYKILGISGPGELVE